MPTGAKVYPKTFKDREPQKPYHIRRHIPIQPIYGSTFSPRTIFLYSYYVEIILWSRCFESETAVIKQQRFKVKPMSNRRTSQISSSSNLLRDCSVMSTAFRVLSLSPPHWTFGLEYLNKISIPSVTRSANAFNYYAMIRRCFLETFIFFYLFLKSWCFLVFI